MKTVINPIHLTFEAAKTIIIESLNETSAAIGRRDYRAIKKCFGTCERLYKNGNACVRILIENLYIYSLSLHLPADNKRRHEVEELLPAQLNLIYRSQLYQHGC